MKKFLIAILVVAALATMIPVSAGNPACRFIFDEVHCEDGISY